jgi:hypothetical protein
MRWDAHVNILSGVRRVRAADDCVLAACVPGAVAELQLHRRDALLGRRPRVAFLLGMRLSHRRTLFLSPSSSCRHPGCGL